MVVIDLKNKNALITGASRGIGAAIAYKLAQAGANVVINYNQNQQPASELANKIKSDFNITPLLFKANISNLQEVKQMKEFIHSNLGKIDILINNTGINKDKLLRNLTDEEWLDVINVNLNGVFYVTREFIGDMIEKRYGRIINISSIVALSGSAGQTNYCASKAGIIGFSKALAREYAKRNITVNVVAPGYIETDMTNKLPEKIKESIINSIPLGRTGKPEDVANLVVFLASDLASYITGEVINISGGLYM
ncbi:MAG: 3-oxoacyl-[acyl-carrier-protein] reductase [bacterium]|nr:3-oxoacyl-[acyl-carrier-protein] reductase [bacterium]